MYQVTTMLATSKNVLFPGDNHLLIGEKKNIHRVYSTWNECTIIIHCAFAIFLSFFASVQ